MAERYPFTPFPESWYFVVRSDELARGPQRAMCCGKSLRIARPNGELEARTVVGDVPVGAPWPVCERNGMVFVYQGGEPRYALPELPEYGSPRFGRYRRLSWLARTHVQETAENAVDFAHFQALHKHIDYPEAELFELDGPEFRVVFHARRQVLGRTVGTTVRLHYFGLGMVVARVSAAPVEVVVVLTYTPVDAEHTSIRMSYMVEKSRIPFVNWVVPYFLDRDIEEDFARDIPVWEHKAYLPRPVLCAGDGPIMKLRKWASQFYAHEL